MSAAAAEASSGTLRDQTYVPDAVDELASVLSLLEKCDPEARYLLVGTREGERIELPEHAQAVLVQVVRAMAAGNAVVVSPVAMKLTRQQAADVLGVSRPISGQVHRGRKADRGTDRGPTDAAAG